MARGGGLGQGFLMGTQAAKGLLDLYNQANQQNELEAIANAKPEVMQGYTAQQGADLSAAAASGQYDIGVKTKDDGTFDSYTVTPKADPSQTGVIAQQGVTNFMGNRSAGTMTDDQVNRARTMAMAGVVAKTNPIEGLRMQQAVKAGERDDKLFDVQMDRADREKRKADDEDAFNAARRNAYGQSIHGRNMNKYVQDYQAWEQGGKQGDAPTMPTYSLAQSLADPGTMLSINAQYGKADPKALQQYAATMKQVRDEGYGAALKVAQSGGSAAQIAEAFNKSGTMKVEPGAIQVTRSKGADGMPTTTLAIRDAQGKVQTINVLAELDALGQADKIFDRFYRAEDNRRGNAQLALAQNRDGRDAASSAITNRLQSAQADEVEARATARKEANAAQAELNAAIDSGDTRAEAAARKKLTTFALSSKGANMDPLERKAALYLGSGRAKTMAEALDLAHQKVQASPRDDYMKLTTGPMPKGDKELDAHMKILHGDDWKQKVSSETPAPKVGSSPYPEGTELVKDGKTYVVKGGVPVLK
jgi:hypothetical protein